MIFWITSAVLTAACVAMLWQALFAVQPVRRMTKIMAVAIAIIIPAGKMGLYALLGSVEMPDFPARLIPAEARNDEALLLQERPLIRQLRQDPTQEAVWVKLITIYVQTGKIEQAQQAYDDAVKSVPKPHLLNDPAFKSLKR